MTKKQYPWLEFNECYKIVTQEQTLRIESNSIKTIHYQGKELVSVWRRIGQYNKIMALVIKKMVDYYFYLNDEISGEIGFLLFKKTQIFSITH